MRDLLAMLIMVMIVTMPLASAQSTYTPSLSAGDYKRYVSSGIGNEGYTNRNFVGEAINVYVDHYEPTVLTSNLIEQDDVPVFVFLRGNTLGSFLGVQDSAEEPLYGTPNIRRIIPKVVNGSKYVKSVNYVPPREMRLDYAQLSRESGQNIVDSFVGGLNTIYQETVDATGRLLDTRGIAYRSDVPITNDLDNLGMLVIRLGRIPKEEDVPNQIELTLSADVYFNTDRSLSYGKWTMPLRQYSEQEWLRASGYDSNGVMSLLGLGNLNLRRVINSISGRDPGGEAIGTNLLGDEGSFLYGKGYLRASKIEKDKATIFVYDGSLRNLGQTTLKVGGEESRFFQLGGDYGNTNEGIRLRLDNIVDPDESFVVVDVIVEDEIKREMLRKGDFLYDGSRWQVREIIEEGEDIRVILMDSLGQIGDRELTAKLTGQTQKLDEGGGDPCVVGDYFSTGNYNNEDPVELYCGAIKDLRKVVEQYADVQAEKEIDNEKNKYYGDLARYKISDAYFQIAETFEARSYLEQSREEEYQKKSNAARKIALDEAGYISDAALFREAVQKIENKIFSPPQTIDDLGKRITVKVVNVYGRDSGGVRASVNGAQSLLREGSEIGESGYIVEDIKQNEVIVKKKETEDKAFDWSYTFTGKKLGTNVAGNAVAVDSITSMAITESGKKYYPLIDKYANQEGVDPDLVKALIEKESSFNPDAVSTCAAVGLMQLIKSTAEGYGKLNVPEYGWEDISNTNCAASGFTQITKCYKKNDGTIVGCDKENDDRFDPEKNIMSGTKYLKELINIHGSIEKALQAYNAGANKVSYARSVISIYNEYRAQSKKEPYSSTTTTNVVETTSKQEEITEFIYEGGEIAVKIKDNLFGNSFPELKDKDDNVFELKANVVDNKLIVYRVYIKAGTRRGDSTTETYQHEVGKKVGDEIRISELQDSDGKSYDLIIRIEKINQIEKENGKYDTDVGLKFIMRYEQEGDELTLKRGSYKYDFTGVEGRAYELTFPTRSTDRVALVTVIPGLDDVVSKSEFYVRIPVEKRAFNLTNEQIDSYLETTNKTIEKLDNIIKTLDKVVENWKKICVYTYFFIMAKSLLLGGKSGAREAVIQGYDGRHGWKEYCQNKVANGEYSTYDKCIFDNADLINNQIEEFDESMGDFNGDLKDSEGDITQTTAYTELKKEFTSLENAGNLRNLIVSNEDVKKYLYYKSVKQTEENNPFSGEFERLHEEIKLKDESFQKAWSLVNNPENKLSDDEKEKILRTLYRDIQNDKIEKQQSSVESEGILRTGVIEDVKFYAETILAAKGDNLKPVKIKGTLSNVFIDQLGQVKSYDIGENNYETLNLVPVPNKEIEEDSWYLFNLVAYDSFEVGIKDILGIVRTRAEISGGVNTKELLNKIVDEFHDGTIGIVRDLFGDYTSRSDRTMEILGMPLYRTSEKNQNGEYEYYLVLNENRPNDDSKGYSFNTNNLVAQFYPDGKPYCVPYDKSVKIEGVSYENGLYLMVRDFYNDGGPKDIQLWNVGPDGMLCSGDDTLLLHESVLTNSPQYKQQRNIFLAYLQNMRCRDGGTIKTGKGEFVCKANAASREISTGQTHCTDVMSTGDCKLMFNVCDPVMCPTSRFNLGGKWYVKDVIQSGFIGSIVLGLPNWGSDQVVPPVCLTGVDAAFKNLKSIFEGAQQCLMSAKTSGQSVGICDRIRNLFICEVMWKEGVGILELVNGLLGGRSGDSGGGEYLNFKSNFDNAGDSLNYFVNDYATTVYSAYRGRSLTEFGTEICKSAIHGKIPGLGDIVNQLSKPSDPPQFTAFVSELPYSETAEASKYSVYYHIYAGTNDNPYTGYQGVTYSVFLLNDEGDAYYVTDGQCGRSTRANVPSGGMVDKNVDCVAPMGFNQVCVDINNQRECGFGKVTSAFSLDWLNDQLVKQEVNKEIDTEEECVPDRDTSLGSSLGLPTLGINRVCSTVVPGDANDWVAVGTCGKDSQGRSLGECWVSRKSIDIKHEGDAAEITEKLDELQKEYEKLRKARETGVDVSAIKSGADAEAEVEKIITETSGKPQERIEKLRNFVSVSISRKANARALYVIAKEFISKANTLAEPIIKEGKEKKKETKETLSAVLTVANDINEWTKLFDEILSEESMLIKSIRDGTRTEHVDATYEGFTTSVDRLLSQADGLIKKTEASRSGLPLEQTGVLLERINSKKQELEKFKTNAPLRIKSYNGLIELIKIFKTINIDNPERSALQGFVTNARSLLDGETSGLGNYRFEEDRNLIRSYILRGIYDIFFKGDSSYYEQRKKSLSYKQRIPLSLRDCDAQNNLLKQYILDEDYSWFDSNTFELTDLQKDKKLNVFNLKKGFSSKDVVFEGLIDKTKNELIGDLLFNTGKCYYDQHTKVLVNLNLASSVDTTTKNAYFAYFESILWNFEGIKPNNKIGDTIKLAYLFRCSSFLTGNSGGTEADKRNSCQNPPGGDSKNGDIDFGRGLFRCAYVGGNICGSCSSITTTSSCDIYTPKGYWDDAANFFSDLATYAGAFSADTWNAIEQAARYGRWDRIIQDDSWTYQALRSADRSEGPFAFNKPGTYEIYGSRLPSTRPEWKEEMCVNDPCGVTKEKTCNWDSTGDGSCS